jgi:putative acetyltransferase
MQPTTSDLRTLSLRPFRPEDQDAVKALILAGLKEHWGTLDPSLNPDLDDIATTYADATFLLACQGSRIVGTGGLKPRDTDAGEIVRMSVAAGCRRRGIGRRILDALIAAARDQDFARIILETTQTWAGAVAFYQAAGFEITHHQDGDVYFVMHLTPRP